MNYKEIQEILSNTIKHIEEFRTDEIDEYETECALKEMSRLDMDASVKSFRKKEKEAIKATWEGKGLQRRIDRMAQPFIDAGEPQCNWDEALVDEVLEATTLKTRQDKLYHGCFQKIKLARFKVKVGLKKT